MLFILNANFFNAEKNVRNFGVLRLYTIWLIFNIL